jgi:trehalose/maltose transport system permease protein
MKAFSKLFVIVCCVAAAAPVLWHGISSFKTTAELALVPPTIVPHDATLQNYRELFIRRPFFRYYVNSITIAAMSALLCVGAASMAAFVLARTRNRFRTLARWTLLAIAFFPPIVFLLPVYELVRAAGLVNHPWGLIFPYAALNLPFAIWLLIGSFEQIPFELEEAAAIDGLSRLQTFRRIVLPLAAPALVTAGILVFIFAWNEFMFALTFINMESQKTVTLGVATLSGAFVQETPWGQIAAGVIASSTPLILLVIVFQRKIVAGLTSGAVK